MRALVADLDAAAALRDDRRPRRAAPRGGRVGRRDRRAPPPCGCRPTKRCARSARTICTTCAAWCAAWRCVLAPTPSLLKLALEVRPDRVVLASEPAASRLDGAPLDAAALRHALPRRGARAARGRHSRLGPHRPGARVREARAQHGDRGRRAVQRRRPSTCPSPSEPPRSIASAMPPGSPRSCACRSASRDGLEAGVLQSPAAGRADRRSRRRGSRAGRAIPAGRNRARHPRIARRTRVRAADPVRLGTRLEPSGEAAMKDGIWPLVGAATMRALDRHTIAVLGVPGELLMESAGRAVVDAVLAGRAGAAGPVARRLRGGKQRRRRLRRRAPSAPARRAGAGRAGRRAPQAARRRREQRGASREARRRDRDAALRIANTAVIVDALFGTGLDRAIGGAAAAAIRRINGARPQARVVAIDLPSGLDADTGRYTASRSRRTHGDDRVAEAGARPGTRALAGRPDRGRAHRHRGPGARRRARRRSVDAGRRRTGSPGATGSRPQGEASATHSSSRARAARPARRHSPPRARRAAARASSRSRVPRAATKSSR